MYFMKVKKTEDIRKLQKMIKKDMLGEENVPRAKMRKLMKNYMAS
jgi:hypothetical protein